MTSTNFNIGFSESKNSSRVLKPPGGGHTDIFGIREDNEIQTPSKRKNHPQTTISSCFFLEETTKPNDKKIKEKEDVENGNENGVKTEVIDENTEPKEVNENKDKIEIEKTEQNATVAPPRRVRVPPGGFSSVLW